ncbi:CHAT domain-containing protein [Roseateles sp. YR242]|uniref:CHAT domain-containing protein n=1 Tax=Roseateles sp. YR242 TaxID=1855305 RepID=UPI0008CDCBB8|nr:CHAT domain-containing protein [Roseateles sp. YR242]SEL89417.1 CHAT domain-containing protein [Roseateles sp. YR242]
MWPDPIQRLAPLQPESLLSLDRNFFVIELAENDGLTHAGALALMDAQPSAAWFLLRWWHQGALQQAALRRNDLRTFLGDNKQRADRRLLPRLGVLPPPVAPVHDLQRYEAAGDVGAVVVDEDGVPMGVTTTRRPTTRGGRLTLPDRYLPDRYLADDALLDAALDMDEAPPVAPHRLDASIPAQVRVGDTVTLVIALDRLERAQATIGDIDLHPGEPLEITVQGDARLQPVNGNSVPLGVPATETFRAVSFDFRTLEVGPARIKAFAFRNGISVARMVLGVNVVLPYEASPPNQVQIQEVLPLPAPSVDPQPDLRLLVMESATGLRFQLRTAGGGVEDFPAVALHDLPTRMREFVGAIEGLTIGKQEAAEKALRQLQSWGADLFSRLIPEPLQALLWKHQGTGTLTLQVCSDDGWIPWEACRLVREDANGRTVEGPFLAEAFAMTRWLHGGPAPSTFRLSRCALVVPSDSRLDTASRERDYYLALAKNGRLVTEVTPRYLPLTRALESGAFDAWHFCGHANAGALQQGDRAALRLEGNETMTASLFAGTVENALLPRPFIFFNACQSALGGAGLTGVGGWAHRFIRPNRERHGAAVFIGTYWSVYDEAAHAFATALYDGLQLGLPIGAAALQARRQARDQRTGGRPGDPLSWLAYTVYADPLARLEVHHEVTDAGS